VRQSIPWSTTHEDAVEHVDQPDEEDAEHAGRDDRAVEPFRVGEVLLRIVDDEPPEAATQSRGDLTDNGADDRRGGGELQRGDEVGHRGWETELEQGRAVRRRIGAHQLQREAARGHEATERVHRHREEGEVGRDDRHRHPRLPVAERQLVAPRDDDRRECDERDGLRNDDPRKQPALQPP
jgi:hypothetical protein